MPTPKSSGAAAETEQLEADVRRIVKEGLDVQERAQAFSKTDLSRMQQDLRSLQSLIVETLQDAATRTRDASGQIFSDLATHAQRSGSATGEQAQQTLAAVTHSMTEAGKANAQAGMALAQATADTFRAIAAGMLGGLADHVQPKPRHHKP